MEAMTVTTRTIANNVVFDEIKKREMHRHTEKVNEIMTLRHQKLKTMEIETEKISGMLRKAKEAAKQFESKEKDLVRKKQNKILLEKLWRISEGKFQTTIPTPCESEPTFKHINHRAELQRRVSERIHEQNKYLARNLIEQSKNKRSKTQIRSEIKEYLALRDSIRKKKAPEEIAKSRKSLVKTRSDFRSRYHDLEDKQPQEKRSSAIPV